MKNSIEPLFSDKKLQTEFDSKGFVKVPLLNTNEVDTLVKLYNQTSHIHADTNSLHHTTTDTRNEAVIRKVDMAIKQMFVPALEKIMLDFKPLAGCFHIKECGSGSATGIHQDPTFVDESRYVSANVWVALHDMNEQNGHLYFIPGSNKIPCLRITPDSPSYYANFYGDLKGMAEPVSMKKGEAVIFNNATIHGATDNLSNRVRLAATLLVCSNKADWLIFYRDKKAVADEAIEKFTLDFNSFIDIPKNGRPAENVPHSKIQYSFPKLNKEEFIKASGLKRGYLEPFKTFLKQLVT